MTQEDRADVIRILLELGFKKGATAFYGNQPVQLLSDPFFQNGNNVASMSTTMGEVPVGDLENVATRFTAIDSLIAEIRNNETPVKEAIILQLEELKGFIRGFDPLRERRKNQLLLIQEAEKLEMQVKVLLQNGNDSLADSKEDRARILRECARAFDRDDKNLNSQRIADMNESIMNMEVVEWARDILEAKENNLNGWNRIRAVATKLLELTGNL